MSKVRLSDIQAIDIHTHMNTGSLYDTKVHEGYRADLEYLNQMRMAANIGPMCCSTFASVLDTRTIEEENLAMQAACEANDYLYQWVVIDPRIEGTFKQAAKMLGTKKCVGIKLHPVYHKYTLDEYGDKVFSFASEYSAIVLIHPEGPATHILPMADKYPQVKFIMAHLGSDPNDNIAGIRLAKNGNVYTDVATAGSVNNRVLEFAVSEVGSEKILFGTDTYAAGFIRGRVEYAMISEEDKINILRNNALRLFGDKLK